MVENWKSITDLFGHEIYLRDDEYTISENGNEHFAVWRYADNDKPIEEDAADRKCPKCNGVKTSEGHDPCIANLPDVRVACCGHGLESNRAYIIFNDGREVRGEEEVNRAVTELKVVK